MSWQPEDTVHLAIESIAGHAAAVSFGMGLYWTVIETLSDERAKEHPEATATLRAWLRDRVAADRQRDGRA